mmetsp:Transcript_47867/g.154331  ORF Transcript_47867/g.154331 Transcript_47867/m.154331 type:complete len:218 (+) Transcript_47867:2314-2967(+)
MTSNRCWKRRWHTLLAPCLNSSQRHLGEQLEQLERSAVGPTQGCLLRPICCRPCTSLWCGNSSLRPLPPPLARPQGKLRATQHLVIPQSLHLGQQPLGLLLLLLLFLILLTPLFPLLLVILCCRPFLTNACRLSTGRLHAVSHLTSEHQRFARIPREREPRSTTQKAYLPPTCAPPRSLRHKPQAALEVPIGPLRGAEALVEQTQLQHHPQLQDHEA